jgi:murein DD-endopeptidase MepM/ murein hydrolase activator NlpD
MTIRFFILSVVSLTSSYLPTYAQSSGSYVVYNGVALTYDSGNFLSKQGIDISSVRNEVYALSDGIVVSTFRVAGNISVIIRSGQEIYVHSKLGASSLRKADMVKKGQIIGTILPVSENSYRLHFEVWRETGPGKVSLLSLDETTIIAGVAGAY